MNSSELKTLETIQERHLALAAGDKNTTDILAFIVYTRRAGAGISHRGARGHLQTMLRYWAYALYKEAGVFPDTTLDQARKTLSC
jgi:hypothetical protein